MYRTLIVFLLIAFTGSATTLYRGASQRLRCGVSDRVEEYSLFGKSWNKRNLTWDLVAAANRFQFYLSVAVEAFEAWSEYADISFTRSTTRGEKPDIMIYFIHNDPVYNMHDMFFGHVKCMFAMDDGVLGHAFFPNSEQDTVEIHMNAEISWGRKPPDYNLLPALTHEIGHALGLRHSNYSDALMYPPYKEDAALTRDDIVGIQSLYGPATGKLSPSTAVKKTSRRHERYLCTLDVREMKFVIIQDDLYILRKNRVWVMNLATKKFLRRDNNIHSVWEILPPNAEIKAIYQRPNDQVVIVTNEEIFILEYPGFELRARSDHSIMHPYASKELAGIVNTYRGKTYIFFRDNFYRMLDECRFQSRGFNFTSRVFAGIPSVIDDVFRFTNGQLYFFFGDTFFEFDEFSGTIRRSGKTSLDMFGVECPDQTLLEQLKMLIKSSKQS